MELSRLAVSLSRAPAARAAGGATAAVALVLSPADAGLELLFIRRALRADDHWSGHIALPGGRREPGEDLLATALRETREETGVLLSRGQLVGELDDLVPRTPAPSPVVVRPFVFALAERPRVALDAREAAGFRWLSLDELLRCAGSSLVDIPGRGPVQTPSFACGDYVIWGMTRRILAGFFERLG